MANDEVVCLCCLVGSYLSSLPGELFNKECWNYPQSPKLRGHSGALWSLQRASGGQEEDSLGLGLGAGSGRTVIARTVTHPSSRRSSAWFLKPTKRNDVRGRESVSSHPVGQANVTRWGTQPWSPTWVTSTQGLEPSAAAFPGGRIGS